ncbi:uncharacterized protein LOC135370935 [Ornithodoros turicata]|uniref:uncharacterized protein LOC135370935 n=1 Tax=Ornithodoros turicata TaxID=34597 RepID=UPI0031386F58
MAQASRLPVMPAAIFAKRRNIENLPGIHVIYDTPVRFCQGLFPASMFDGVTVSYLAYFERDPVLFRVAVCKDVQQAKFVEMGIFEDEGVDIRNNIVCKTRIPTETQQTKSSLGLPGPRQYAWAEFSFSGTNGTEFRYNGTPLLFHNTLQLDELNSYIAWHFPTLNNATILEVHATYPSSASSTFFHLGEPINVTNTGNIRVGGRLVVVGNYKRTTSQSDDIQFKVQTWKETAKICAIKKPSQDDLTIVFERRTTRLICQVGNKAEWKLEDYDMNTTTAISVVQNFEVKLIRQFTGMSTYSDFK